MFCSRYERLIKYVSVKFLLWGAGCNLSPRKRTWKSGVNNIRVAKSKQTRDKPSPPHPDFHIRVMAISGFYLPLPNRLLCPCFLSKTSDPVSRQFRDTPMPDTSSFSGQCAAQVHFFLFLDNIQPKFTFYRVFFFFVFTSLELETWRVSEVMLTSHILL